jgi:hypothetical protein
MKYLGHNSWSQIEKKNKCNDISSSRSRRANERPCTSFQTTFPPPPPRRRRSPNTKANDPSAFYPKQNDLEFLGPRCANRRRRAHIFQSLSARMHLHRALAAAAKFSSWRAKLNSKLRICSLIYRLFLINLVCTSINSFD